MSNSLQLHGLYSPWNSPGQKTGMGSYSLLQGIFPTQGWNPGLPRCRWFFTSWATSPGDEREKPTTKITPPSKDLIQIQQRKQKLYRQANAKRIQLIQMNLFIKQTHRFQKSYLWLPKGKCRGSNKLGDWGKHLYTTINKTDNQQGPPTA